MAELTTLTTFHRLYRRYKLSLACIGAFCLPLKLSVAYWALIPLILLALSTKRGSLFRDPDPLFIPLLLFACAATIASLFGLDPLHSFKSLASLWCVILLVPILSDVVSEQGGYKPLLCLFVGQTVAAFYTTIRASFVDELPKLFLGKVTESGQIGLTLIVATGFVLFLSRSGRRSPWDDLKTFAPPKLGDIFVAALQFSLLFLIGFSSSFQLSSSTVGALIAIALLNVIISLVRSYKFSCRGLREHALSILISQVLIPTIITGLLVNLKRGPWSGVLIGGGILLALYCRKLLIPVIIAAIVLCVSVEPVRLRLQQSSRDFFIHGGRNVIWQVGAELFPRYPLGIGYANSSFLQRFSNQIPPELRHFHNNGLNILVETGWIGLALFFWWFIAILRRAFDSRYRDTILVPAIGCSLISWQIAGIVEYNVGDSEVMLIVYILVGTLTAIAPRSKQVKSVVNELNTNSAVTVQPLL